MKEEGFYRVVGVSSVIGFNNLGCVYGISWFPCVVTFGVAMPFDEVLEGSGSSVMLVAPYLFYLVFFFPIDKVRWWPGEVRSVSGRFVIGR